MKKKIIKTFKNIRKAKNTFLEKFNFNSTYTRCNYILRSIEHNLKIIYIIFISSRPALCDLARVLQLLNMSESRLKAITLPNDWPSLMNRAERTLRRYQRRQAELPDAQLISFLQSSPTFPQPPCDRQPLTTFRPQESSSTSPNLGNLYL